MARRTLGLLLAPFLMAATFGPLEGEQTQQPVEQQTPGGATQPDRSLWVTNPTGCAWDADDSRSTWFRDQTLAAGETATATKCVVVDAMDHSIWVEVLSGSPNLIVELRFGAPFNYVFRGNPIPVGRDYRNWVCALGPVYQSETLPTLPEIAGSNGGRGVVSDVTISVTNPTNHAVRKATALLRLDFSPETASGGQCQFTTLVQAQNRIGFDPLIYRLTS